MTTFRTALLVEDLPETRRWLGDILVEAFPGIAVSPAESLASARDVLARIRPDIALIDLGLPDGSGIDLLAGLRHLHPACECIITTIYDDDAHLFPALRAGARGYLLKEQPRDRLLARLRGIGDGEAPLSPTIARRLLRMFAPDTADGAPVQPDKLSPRERETLILIAKGYRLNEVADTLGVTRNTAAGYIKSVYRKLEVNSRAEAALAAARMGLIAPTL
ncbi:response regulator [Algiphilus sp.]|uniref:response regulator n=1 Tax=Algiphilus sp. TaxID=1872431 RepID=UPI0025C20B87|nr:response regulator transcription factor [Algiphilus sp.]MCK5769028.1 response regulator transcription factor [Algiphilus sp.]